MRVNQPIYDNCFHCSYKQGNTCTCQAVCLHDKQVYSYSESTNSMRYDTRTRTGDGERTFFQKR